jgi:hypothetical protein
MRQLSINRTGGASTKLRSTASAWHQYLAAAVFDPHGDRKSQLSTTNAAAIKRVSPYGDGIFIADNITAPIPPASVFAWTILMLGRRPHFS